MIVTVVSFQSACISTVTEKSVIPSKVNMNATRHSSVLTSLVYQQELIQKNERRGSWHTKGTSRNFWLIIH